MTLDVVVPEREAVVRNVHPCLKEVRRFEFPQMDPRFESTNRIISCRTDQIRASVQPRSHSAFLLVVRSTAL